MSKDNLYVNRPPPWDASFYTLLARDFYGSLETSGPYRIQRILPSAIVYHALRFLSIQATDANIIQSFSILNALLILLIGYLWCVVADELAISSRGKWLGFTGLLLNFAVLKHGSYSPIHTDIAALAIGMLLLHFWVARKALGLYLITAIGSFVWPTVLLQGSLLLLFPRREKGEKAPSSISTVSKSLSLIMSSLMASFTFLFITSLRGNGFTTVLPPFNPAFNLSLAI